MKENEITKRAKADLEKAGIIHWTAVKRRGFAEQDIFGLFDLILLFYDKKGSTAFGALQVTTRHHLSDRRAKIRRYFADKGLAVPPRVWLWGYDRDADRFIKEIIK